MSKIELICECGKKATWIRHTQFAGDHPFCTEHAKKEKDFKKNNSYLFWEKLIKNKTSK